MASLSLATYPPLLSRVLYFFTPSICEINTASQNDSWVDQMFLSLGCFNLPPTFHYFGTYSLVHTFSTYILVNTFWYIHFGTYIFPQKRTALHIYDPTHDFHCIGILLFHRLALQQSASIPPPFNKVNCNQSFFFFLILVRMPSTRRTFVSSSWRYMSERMWFLI